MQNPPNNRLALISFFTVILSVISFCIGAVPIPLTSLFCYPVSFVLNVLSFITGWAALRQIRLSGERGRGLALAGVWISLLTSLAMICMVAITISLVPLGVDFIQKGWNQLHP
jgi:hypothetical protein